MAGIEKDWLVARETPLRSWTKSLVWRIAGFVILGVTTYIFTGDWKESIGISSVFNLIRFVLYYYHERMWLRISWGIKAYPFRK